MKYQGQSTDESEEPGEFLETFDLLDENDDEQPDRRPLEPMEDFDIVSEDTDEQCDAHRTAQEAHASVSAPVQPPMNDSYHHGMRVRALHMKTVWHDVVTGGTTSPSGPRSWTSRRLSVARACLCFQAVRVPGA